MAGDIAREGVDAFLGEDPAQTGRPDHGPHTESEARARKRGQRIPRRRAAPRAGCPPKLVDRHPAQARADHARIEVTLTVQVAPTAMLMLHECSGEVVAARDMLSTVTGTSPTLVTSTCIATGTPIVLAAHARHADPAAASKVRRTRLVGFAHELQRMLRVGDAERAACHRDRLVREEARGQWRRARCSQLFATCKASVKVPRFRGGAERHLHRAEPGREAGSRRCRRCWSRWEAGEALKRSGVRLPLTITKRRWTLVVPTFLRREVLDEGSMYGAPADVRCRRATVLIASSSRSRRCSRAGGAYVHVAPLPIPHHAETNENRAAVIDVRTTVSGPQLVRERGLRRRDSGASRK